MLDYDQEERRKEIYRTAIYVTFVTNKLVYTDFDPKSKVFGGIIESLFRDILEALLRLTVNKINRN